MIASVQPSGDAASNSSARQRSRRSRQLQARLIQMIEVEVRVAERVHELAGLA